MAEIIKPEGLSKIWALTGDKNEPSDTKKNAGWIEEIPTFQDFNWLDNRQDTAIAHINQHGIPVWDSTTEYIINKALIQGSDGNIYSCKATNTNQNPVSDASNTYWELFLVASKKSKVSTTLTLLNSWTNLTGTTKAEVINGVLRVRGNIANGTTVGSVNIATLPAGYRPAAEEYVSSIFLDGAAYTPFLVTVKTSGNIEVTGITSNTNVYLNFSLVL